MFNTDKSTKNAAYFATLPTYFGCVRIVFFFTYWPRFSPVVCIALHHSNAIPIINNNEVAGELGHVNWQLAFRNCLTKDEFTTVFLYVLHDIIDISTHYKPLCHQKDYPSISCNYCAISNMLKLLLKKHMIV